MARSARFERATAGTANQCSIQLSYERILLWTGIIQKTPVLFKGFSKIPSTFSQKVHRPEEFVGFGVVNESVVVGVFEEMAPETGAFRKLLDVFGDTAEQNEFHPVVQA